MDKIKFSDFKIIVIPKSIERLKISDSEYFSEKYKDYISNSKLKYINPTQNGSPVIYKQGIIQENTSSLSLGSSVHELLLQSDEFILLEELNKPSAKLGQLIDKVWYYRQSGYTIDSAIKQSSTDVEYYSSSLTNNRIKTIIQKGLFYYLNIKNIKENNIVLSNKETITCKECISSLQSNNQIMDLLNPTDIFGEKIESYNEDALFLDIEIKYKTRSVILKLKMKADNWTIDKDSKILVLNDLKTTGNKNICPSLCES